MRLGSGALQIHVCSTKCPCIPKSVHYGAFSLVGLQWSPFSFKRQLRVTYTGIFLSPSIFHSLKYMNVFAGFSKTVPCVMPLIKPWLSYMVLRRQSYLQRLVAPNIFGLSVPPFLSLGYLKGVVHRTNWHAGGIKKSIPKLQLQTLLLQHCAKCLQIWSKGCVFVFMNIGHACNVNCNHGVLF